MPRVLVTGAAGFIGFHLSSRLLKEGYEVSGIDNLNAYYEVSLKLARLGILEQNPGFHFQKMELLDKDPVIGLISNGNFDYVVHLAAQAGVAHSLKHPHLYAESNIVGFLNILEGCRNSEVKHLVFASSSSVYGLNKTSPFSVTHNVDHPVSLYAATKKANELMAHCYSHLYGLRTTGLRFFSVYGPWGRPDMALFIFTRAILAGEPIPVYNYGNMERDFTYVDDIVEGLCRVMLNAPEPNPDWSEADMGPASSSAPYRVYNIGNNRPVQLLRFIELIEKALGKEAKKEFLPIRPGDVASACADVDALTRDVGFRPNTPVEEGIREFVKWYKEYYRV